MFQFSYQIRMGTAVLGVIQSTEGFDVRRVIDILPHPKYIPGRVYYDVGIVVTSEVITFTDYIRPVCLPYLPVDNGNFEEENVQIVGWNKATSNGENNTKMLSTLRSDSVTVGSIIVTFYIICLFSLVIVRLI